MTSKTETTSIPEIDFDSWTPEQEEAALKQIAQASKCKYAIGDNHFYLSLIHISEPTRRS